MSFHGNSQVVRDRKWLQEVQNPAGDVVERIVPGAAPIESYFEHMEKYVFAASRANLHSTVLDLACGVGYGSYHLARKGFNGVIGIDRSKAAVGYARAVYAKLPNLAFITADAENLPISSSAVNVLTSFETVEHLENADAFLLESGRVLKEGGLLILSTPNKHLSLRRQAVNPYHVRELFLAEMLDKLVSLGFQAKELYGQGIRAQRNQLSESMRTRAFIRTLGRLVLPDPVEKLLRNWVLLPRRTGIPRRIVMSYKKNPERFEEWITEHSFHSHYRPYLLQASDLDVAQGIFSSFIVVAEKAG